MTSTANYSPVVKFSLESSGETVVGYAAPRSGGQTCLVALTSDDRPIFYARASRYSAQAMKDGFRGGWCGFEMPGIAQAFSAGDTVRLSCGVSGEVLADLDFDPALFSDGAQVSVTLSPRDVLNHARRSEMAPGVEHILPFAIAHFERHGPRAFVEAAYQTFLRRWPEDAVVFQGDPAKTDDARVRDYLLAIGASQEAMQVWEGDTPGPFHQAFRFDRPGLMAT